MDLKIVIASILILLIPLTGQANSGRNLAHEQRLDGLDLSQRGLKTYEYQASTIALAAGDDLRISSSVSPARFDQNRARTIQTNTGNWWVVWEDNRLGSRKIFRQIFDANGVAISDNEIIAGSEIGSNFTDPRLAIDTAGHVYFAYRDQTAGMIFAARYLADGTFDGPTLLINDTTLNSFAGPFDMSVFPDGQMVVAWENYSTLGSTIEMRVYTPAGISLEGPTTVNTDGGSVTHWVPAIAHAPGSGFLIVWEDYRNGQADIYARQFTGAGVSVGSDFSFVPSPDNSAGQYSPSVAYSAFDKYVIGWIDNRIGWEIYLQRYNQTIGLVGENLLVSSGHMLVANRDLDMDVSSTGVLNLLWSASGADNTIQSLELDSGLAPSGLPRIVNLSDTGQRWAPSVGYGVNNSFTAVWTESIDDDPDISLMLFNADGGRILSSEITVNDDSTGAHSVDPKVIATNNWRNLVVYSDGRYDQGDVFIRAITNAGTIISGEHRINQDVGFALQSEPTLAVSLSRALVVWNDARTLAGFSGQRIYGRFCSHVGDLTEDEFMISDPDALAVKISPCAAMQPDGSGMVVWLDRRDGAPQVYGRFLAADGNLDGDEFLISEPGIDLAINNLALSGYGGNRFSVVWYDPSSGTPSVQVKLFDTSKSIISTISYTPAASTLNVDEMVADIASDGTAVLFWIGIDGGERHAYLTRITVDGTILTESLQITDSPDAAPSDPSVSVSNNSYFSLAWIDRRDGREVAYYQILDSDLNFLAVNQSVSSTVTEFMESVRTDAYRGRAWFVWSDPREEGLNVFARSLVYLPTDVDDDPPQLPLGYALLQNYPNPFNPSTEIEFTVPSATHAKLIVINPLGQTVTTLMDDFRSAGTHRVIWDGRDHNGDRVASGVYLYRLTTDTFTHTRKMLLLK
ncbi:MAG: T9SS type A sorting domain-containing protein [candidate division Zixibacteria bacterium]|nr:T9SS type A sorting domain-containing protein [candidate division Zixibacteria bacterium]